MCTKILLKHSNDVDKNLGIPRRQTEKYGTL